MTVKVNPPNLIKMFRDRVHFLAQDLWRQKKTYLSDESGFTVLFVSLAALVCVGFISVVWGVM
jgi:hypothetical protein